MKLPLLLVVHRLLACLALSLVAALLRSILWRIGETVVHYRDVVQYSVDYRAVGNQKG